MPAQETTCVPDALRVRRCLSCGHAAEAFQSPVFAGPYACPECGDDLYARPPRSYAELEGFVDAAPMRVVAGPVRRTRFGRVCERVAVVGILVMVVTLTAWAVVGG